MTNDMRNMRDDNRRRRPQYRAARIFVIILGIGIFLATCVHFQELGVKSAAGLHSRNLDILEGNDDKCRLVHSSPNQCAFIKKHCPTDEAGFAAYLDLYFCQLPHLKPIAFIILASWLGALFSTIGIAASDFFCVDLSTMADLLGMSESMAGVTLLALGNGSPDVFSTFAAMSTDSGDLAIGELMGAAGFITAVVAGSMALIRPFKVAKKSFVRDVGFFAVAAAFTMVILADGLLHLWECLAMVGFYLFYVAFVVIWHWIERRRELQLDNEAAARGHFSAFGDNAEIEPYHDDPESGRGRPPPSRGPSGDDFAALERRTDGQPEDDEDYDDEERDRWMSELNTNMRLSRPVTRPRSTTIAPVRPSLVGALEFQAVLKSLQRSRNLNTVPMNSRRYSDDPNLMLSQPNGRRIVHRRASVKEDVPAPSRPPPLQVEIPAESSGASLAYTANEAPAHNLDADLQWRGQGHSATSSHHQSASPSHTVHKQHVAFKTPTIEISHHSPEEGPSSAGAAHRHSHRDLLNRPTDLQASISEDLLTHRKLLRGLNGPSMSPKTSPRLHPNIFLPSPPRSRSATRTAHPGHSPAARPQEAEHTNDTSAFPPLDLPPPVMSSPDQLTFSHETDIPDPITQPRSQWRFWPYRFLPPPEIMAAVLFPTVADWNEKSVWARILGLVAAPSVFLLTITLPVVESDKPMLEPEQSPLLTKDGNSAAVMSAMGQTSLDGNTKHHAEDLDALVDTSEPTAGRNSLQAPSSTGPGSLERTSSSVTILSGEADMTAAAQNHTYQADYWPRWLLLIQLYVAPFIVLLSIYLQSPEPPPLRWLVRPSLICLLVSTVLLIPVLLTTSPTHKPRQYRWILSIAGFAISIAWISTIASQVVGTLKALAIILNWSNAIMGLTIFAVGNSVSDLVADVTVANLGYPVMALSACFGGPMLNILLGIGLSGTYSILRGADHRKHKHPEKGYKLKTFHLDVGQTLIVSGVALLVTLVGLLIFVPLNKWMMTRKIGVALIVVWFVATVGNVVLEVTGFADISRIG